MDLVKIGFIVTANGLKEANAEVDKLLNRVDKIGTSSKKNASEFESSQKKIKKTTEDSTKANDANTKSVDRTTKALERQKLIGEYLGKGLDKTTASAIANFRQLGGTTAQVNVLMSSLASNKGLVQVQKDTARLTKEQEAQAKAVQTTLAQYERLSRASLGGGILDTVEKQNKGLQELNNHYKSLEQQQSKVEKAQQQALDTELAAQNKLNAERQKAISLEQAKAKYVSQGYSKTDSTRLARLEVSGADVTTLNNYKSAIEATTRATQALNPAVEKVTTSHSNFLSQIKGIAIYAALSAAIYGVMTAMTNLTVATVKMADEYTAIQNRMKLYITDTKELGKVNNQLAQFSMQNNVGLRETATLFSRLAPAMQKIGANTAAVTSVVDAFGKSMRIGGATAMEAASATIQFSQAMASGKLAGDEFRSISEASPRFLKAIAEGSGIAAEKLKEMSAAGALTTEIISKALLKEYPKLIEENKKLGVTMEQGANAIKTGFLVAIGEFNEGAGITQALGESMMDLAKSMFEVGQKAKETGEEVKAWFSANASTINTVVDAFKLLATVIAARYVASLVLATAASIKLTYQTSALAAAQTAAMRSFVIGATAVTAFGRAAKAAFMFMGGWVGILLTIGSVAATYLLLRDNAAEATQKLVEQSKYVDITTEAYQRLNKEQQLNARSSIVDDMNEVNEKLDEQAKAVERVLESHVKSRRSSILGMDNGVTDVLDKVTKGVVSYDTALRLLSENKNVPRSLVEAFKKEKEVYDETAKAGFKYAEAAKIVGASSELAGNQAQNATPSVQGMKDAVSDLGDEASITGLKVQAFGQSMQELVGTYTNLLNLRKATGLNETFGTKALEEGQRLAAQNEKIVKAHKWIAEKQGEINNLRLKDVDVSKQQADLDRDRVRLSEAQEKFALKYAKQVAPLAKAAQDAQEANSEYTASLKQQGKELEKVSKQTENAAGQDQKRLQGIRDSYQEQIAYAQRLRMLLGQGVKPDVARIAAEKDYIEVYGKSLDMAREKVALEKDLADETTRSESKYNLDSRIEDLKAINSLMTEGYNLTDAQGIVAAKLTTHTDRALYAERMRGETIGKLMQTKADELNQAHAINNYLQKGKSMDEARLYLNTSLVKAESEGNIQLIEYLISLDRILKLRNTENSVLAESNKLQKLAYVYASQTSNEMGDLIASNEDVSMEALAELKTRGDILKIVKEYNDMLEKQSKESPFANINFDVFGDMGNPFKSALDGLYEFIGGLDKLQDSYAQAVVLAQRDVDKTIAGTKERKEAVEALTKVHERYAMDKAALEERILQNTVNSVKGFTKEHTFAYKAASATEKGFQLFKIAQATKAAAISLGLISAETGAYVKGSIAKIAAEKAATVKSIALSMKQAAASAAAALAASLQAPPPANLASFAAVSALLAGIGIAVGGGGSSGSFAPTNEGKGTVFGDTEAESASIKNSIEAMSNNSDLILPLTSAMLASLRNIESSIGGVTNLIIRQATGKSFNIADGFKQNGIGKGIESTVSTLNKLTFGLADTLSLGLFSAIGKALGGMFGSKTTIKGQGLYGGSQDLGGILSQGFNLQEYADVQTKKKAFGITTSKKNTTQFTEADDVLEKQFTSIFSGFYDSILAASNSLGASTDEVKKKLQDSVIDFGKVDIKGLNGEQIQERLEAVFGAAADNLAQQGFAGLDDFQQVGEGYFETLIRVASSLEQAQYYTDQLNVSTVKYTDVINKQGDVALEVVRQSVLLASTSRDVVGGFDSMVESFSGSASELVSFVQQLRELQVSLALTGKDSQYLTQTMIQGAGGIQALSEGFSSYYDMLSAQEQATHLTAQMTEKFRELGKDLPNSIQGYKDLLRNQEVVTTSGQKLYGQLISLAPEFTELQSALKRAEDEANALKKEAEDLAEAERKAAEEAAKYAATLAEIRQAMFVTRQDGEYLSEAMIKAAGGTDELSKGLQAYFSMLDPAEQATELTRRLTEQFELLGRTLPTSAEGFRLLIEGLDITTMSGQELYGQLIALAPEFNALQSSVKAAEDAERSRREEASRAAEESARVQREAAEAAAKAAEEARELAKRWDELRIMMFVTKQSGKNLNQIMINAAGGIDELASGLESYFSLLSDQEQVEELTRRLNIQFSKLGLALPSTVEEFRNLVEGIDTNTNAGKKLYGQVIALTPQFKELQDMMNSTAEAMESLVHLKFAFETTGKDAQYLTTSIANAAGGVDKLSSGLDAYFDMLSPQEKAIELTRRLTSQFNDIGQTLPSSVDGFRNLISSIDVTTDEGKKLYGQVIALAPEFNTLQDALNSSANEVDDLVKSLRDLADEARKARGEQDKPKNLNITRWQFEQAANKAMLGDVEAAQQLLTLGKDLMEISSAYASSGEDYARDLALIQRAATVAADTQASGLGTSTAPTLSPTTGTNTTPTVATTNTTMTTEMRGMREELNAGLFAIAKFVQNVDSRTERWDDGNRIMVGIQPENGDIPVPVVVTP